MQPLSGVVEVDAGLWLKESGLWLSAQSDCFLPVDGKGVLPGPCHGLLGSRALSLQRCQVPGGKSALGSPLLFMLGGSPFLTFTDSSSSLACLLSLARVHRHTTKGPTVTESCVLHPTPRTPWTAATNALVSLSALEIRLDFRCQRQWLCLQRPIPSPRSDTI